MQISLDNIDLDTLLSIDRSVSTCMFPRDFIDRVGIFHNQKLTNCSLLFYEWKLSYFWTVEILCGIKDDGKTCNYNEKKVLGEA